MVAPPGYGKTTLLTQWAGEDDRPFAWVSVTKRRQRRHGAARLTCLGVEALTPPGEPLPWGRHRRATTLTNAVMSRLGEVLKGLSGPFVLVLDDVHLLHREETFSVLMALAERVPRGSQLVLAGRDDPPLSVARVSRQPAASADRDREPEDDLGRGHAAPQAEGVSNHPAVGDALVNQAEGWPAGLYFAALALREQPDVEQAAKRFAGDDPLIADYLLRGGAAVVTDDQRAFLTGTSVLDRLCGSLCDAVLERSAPPTCWMSSGA